MAIITKSDFKLALNWTALYVLAIIVGLWAKHDLSSLGDYWLATIAYFLFAFWWRRI